MRFIKNAGLVAICIAVSSIVACKAADEQKMQDMADEMIDADEYASAFTAEGALDLKRLKSVKDCEKIENPTTNRKKRCENLNEAARKYAAVKEMPHETVCQLDAKCDAIKDAVDWIMSVNDPKKKPFNGNRTKVIEAFAGKKGGEKDITKKEKSLRFEALVKSGHGFRACKYVKKNILDNNLCKPSVASVDSDSGVESDSNNSTQTQPTPSPTEQPTTSPAEQPTIAPSSGPDSGIPDVVPADEDVTSPSAYEEEV